MRGGQIKSISGSSPVKSNADDITINGVTISGGGGIKKFSQSLGISEKEVMTQQQKALLSSNPQFVKQIDAIGFKSDWYGTWTLDTKIGGGQINLSEGYFGDKEYEANVWNATYNTWDSRSFETLNQAKGYIKDRLKGK